MKIGYATIYWLIHIKMAKFVDYEGLSATRKGYSQVLLDKRLLKRNEDFGSLELTERGEQAVAELEKHFKEFVS